MTTPHRPIRSPQGDLFTPVQPYVPQQLSHLFRPGYLPPQPGSVPQQRAAAPPRQPYPVRGYYVPPPRLPHKARSQVWLVVAAVAVAMLLIAGVVLGLTGSRAAGSMQVGGQTTAPALDTVQVTGAAK